MSIVLRLRNERLRLKTELHVILNLSSVGDGLYIRPGDAVLSPVLAVTEPVLCHFLLRFPTSPDSPQMRERLILDS